MSWTVKFFSDDQGRQPARRWLTSLEPGRRATVIAAIETLLTELGPAVCAVEHGQQLEDGLFEFHVLYHQALLQVFCHAEGQELLLLGGYDRESHPGAGREDREVEAARRCLRSVELRRERLRTGRRRRS
jgi:hypothetical protein